ncbi:hypothetical protein V6N11_019138 [Hibiscus sabdariffa]|uniref:DUF659 domain-containing protein n=1 Tax=Hibiscus sabdariffa TaxID=183260 RepID=A0ABR2R1K2_9ROSI
MFMKKDNLLLMDQLENIVEKDPIPSESEFNLRGVVPELVKSKSLRQPKVTNSPRLYNLIQVSMKVGKYVKLPTPYEVSDVYLASKYEQVRECVNGLKTQWKELGATLICLQHHSRDDDFYYDLLDKVIEEIGEEYIIQIVVDNEAAMKAVGKSIPTLLTFRAKHETFSTPPSQRAWSLMNSGGENAGLFPADSSDDEINVVEQSQEQNLSDSSSCLTPTQSGGDGQDSSTGGLSPICDDDRENVDRGKIRSSRPHGEEYGFGFASGRFRHMSQFGGNMSTTLSGSRERSEFRARSKEKGKGTKMHTYEGSSSRRRSTSSMPMPYQPQMYPPPSSNYMSTRGH